jgi:hypothetical protein
MMTDADKEAFSLAIETARAHDEERRRQIDNFLRERPFEDVGRFASYGCQVRALRLPPWATPPCWINKADIDATIARGDDGTRGNYVAAKLLKHMLALGVSQFHPDPMAAIVEAEKRDAAA